MNPWRRRTNLGSTVLSLAIWATACAGTLGAESFLSRTIEGDDFSACLARAYQDRAAAEAYVDGNWANAALLVRRGQEAEKGFMVLPRDPAEYALTGADRISLTKARARLMRALNDDGRTSRSCACARAQGHYDRWLGQPQTAGKERAAFEKAVGACEARGVGVLGSP